MMRRRLALLAAVAMIVAACGDSAGDDTTTTTTTLATTTAPDTTTTQADSTTTSEGTPTTVTTLPAAPYLTVAESGLGTIVVDDEGMTLYLFIPDDQGASTCTGSCANTWPPLVGDVSAGPGVAADLVGSVERGDGNMQATYNGWPLYRYAPDTEPGNTRGQGISSIWWVVSPDGEAIR